MSISRKKVQKFLLYLLFIGFSAGVIIATAVNEFSNNENAAELATVHLNWWFLIPATLCFVVMIVLEYWKYALMTLKSCKPGAFTKKEAFILGFQTVMIGRYYDRITPAAVGGQPAQILNLRRTGKIPTGSTTAIPIFSMISGQITFIIIAVPCFIVGSFMGTNPVLLTTAWIGLAFYAFWPIMVVGTSISSNFTAKVMNLFVRLLAGLKIVKNKDKIIKRVESEVDDYAKNVKLIAKSRDVMIKVMVMSFFSNVLITLVPFFVLITFGGNINFFECFILSMAIQSAVYYVPTPGNSGVAEGTFYVVFSRLSSGYVFWAMLAWRLFSYYIYIIVGPLIYLHRYFKKRRIKASTKKREKHDHEK